jgi:hypothetical protein
LVLLRCAGFDAVRQVTTASGQRPGIRGDVATRNEQFRPAENAGLISAAAQLIFRGKKYGRGRAVSFIYDPHLRAVGQLVAGKDTCARIQCVVVRLCVVRPDVTLVAKAMTYDQAHRDNAVGFEYLERARCGDEKAERKQ